MAIRIHRSHSLGKKGIREKLEAVKDQLAAELDLDMTWKGDRIVFNKMGVEGYVAYDEDSLEIHAKKPFYVPVSESWLKEQIENSIDQFLV